MAMVYYLVGLHGKVLHVSDLCLHSGCTCVVATSIGLLAVNVVLPDQTFPSSRSGRANTTSCGGWPGCRTGAGSGLVFFTVYFPLITHTYNEVLPNSQPVWPSLTSEIYISRWSMMLAYFLFLQVS
jgi:hypothetical protein